MCYQPYECSSIEQIGNKGLQVDEDQYVMIALALYMVSRLVSFAAKSVFTRTIYFWQDIINLFVNLLQLLSRTED